MLFASVSEQSLPPDELIIVDHFYRERRQAVELLNRYAPGIPTIKHLAGEDRGGIYANSAGFNIGLREASSELVIFLVDFVWLPRNFLRTHWEFYEAHGRENMSLSVYVDRYKYAPFADPIDPREHIISIFKEPFDAARFFIPDNLIYAERKGGAGVPLTEDGRYIAVPGEKIYMLGDSMPLRVLKELNGWDEIYNGGYSANDVCIGTRANMLGWRFAVDRQAEPLKKLGDKSMAHLLPGAGTRFVKTPEQNFAIYENRMRAIAEGRESIRTPKGRGAWE
jgi:hypothetical protein